MSYKGYMGYMGYMGRGAGTSCLMLVWSLALGDWRLSAAAAADEPTLIAVLQSANSSPKEKDAACAGLKRTGTAACVPALAALLSDEQLSHSARYALESLPIPEAGPALIEALKGCGGDLQVGIIGSLGARRETRAVGALVLLLREKDPGVAIAAASALGQIGGAVALKNLEACLQNSSGGFHRTVVDGCLRCADQLVATGEGSKAESVCENLYKTEQDANMRMAAYAGMIRASGNRSVSLVVSGLTGNDEPTRMASLKVVREMDGPKATAALTAVLPKVSQTIQAALVEGLKERGDSAAAPEIGKLAHSASPEVRLAALKALGTLGNASQVELLSQTAATAKGEEQTAARQALGTLNRGEVTASLLDVLQTGTPEVQAEAARALGERRDRAAATKLLVVASASTDSARKAALQALSVLADNAQLQPMVDLVAQAKTEAARNDAAAALYRVYQRLTTTHGSDIRPLQNALAHGSKETRIALLPVYNASPAAELREPLRELLASPDPEIRAAAVHSICDTSDRGLLEDILKLACSASEENFRTLAIAACVRLTTQDENKPLAVEEQTRVMKAILATPLTPEQKRLVLGGLGEIPNAEAFRMAQPLLDDPAVHAEASQAVIKIAAKLPGSEAKLAVPVLQKLASSDEAARKPAADILKQIQMAAEFITDWQVAGPFREAGKDYAALFDIPFAPEKAGESAQWEALAPSVGAKYPGVMDLLKALGGEECVAYVRTWIHSSAERTARLELGTDDGLKVWLNNELLHSKNASRGLQPGSDKVRIALKRGWNPLMLKITQHNQGWEFCARVINTDASQLDGIEFAAKPPKQ